MATNKFPKAFISYSHDSADHKKWVLDLATRLRHSGVESVIDQWALGPGDDLPHFMERNLADADRVLMICTDNYVRKANSGAGGVGYEKMIVTADLLGRIDSNKVIPLIRQSGTHDVPTFLRTKLFINFSLDNEMESAYDDLVRSIHGAPLFVAPPVSNNPFEPAAEVPAEKTVDGVMIVMRAAVRLFESNDEPLLNYGDILRVANISRIMFDLFLDDALNEGLIERNPYRGSLFDLTSKGKMYAINNKLISSR